MTAADISKHLYKHFWNYDYKLVCTYLFAWESDFFAVSKSGYAVEVEIKVTRSDFKADFKKDKHAIFKSLSAGKEIHVAKLGWGNRGDIILKNFPVKQLQLDRRSIRGKYELVERNYYSDNTPRHMQKRYVVNDWDFSRLRISTTATIDIYAPATGIRYTVLSETKTPHQFYYAVPEGLLSVDEIPDYAGLIYVAKDGCQIIKKAKYMHKRKMDLRGELLSKFYHLWLNRTSVEEKIKPLSNPAPVQGA